MKATEFDTASLRALLATRWGWPATTLTHIADSANVTWRAEGGGRVAYLRVSCAHMRERWVTEGAFTWLGHLAGEGAPVCAPQRTLAGALIVDLPDRPDCYATLIANVPGTLYNDVALNVTTVTAWGRALGSLHNASASFPAADCDQIKHIDGMWQRASQHLPRVDAGLRTAHGEVDGAWAGWSRQPHEFGVTHGDFHRGNAIFNNGTVTIIDFDEPARHWYAADIARALLELAALPPAEWRALRDVFLAAYRSVRPLDAVWEARLPLLMRWRAVLMLLWCVHDGLCDDADFFDWLRARASNGVVW